MREPKNAEEEAAYEAWQQRQQRPFKGYRHYSYDEYLTYLAAEDERLEAERLEDEGEPDLTAEVIELRNVLALAERHVGDLQDSLAVAAADAESVSVRLRISEAAAARAATRVATLEGEAVVSMDVQKAPGPSGRVSGAIQHLVSGRTRQVTVQRGPDGRPTGLTVRP